MNGGQVMKDRVPSHGPLPDVERDGEPRLPDVRPEIVRRHQVEGVIHPRGVLQVEEGPLDHDEVEQVERVVEDVVEDREVLVVRRQQGLDLLELDGHLAVAFRIRLGVLAVILIVTRLAPSALAGVERLDDREDLFKMQTKKILRLPFWIPSLNPTFQRMKQCGIPSTC